MTGRSDLDSFAALIDRLGYEPRRNAKLALLTDAFRQMPDPERGYALAALTANSTSAMPRPG